LARLADEGFGFVSEDEVDLDSELEELDDEEDRDRSCLLVVGILLT
jgi:hypothetical protein